MGLVVDIATSIPEELHEKGPLVTFRNTIVRSLGYTLAGRQDDLP